ncbi:MAG: hypothetical protein ACR2PH_10765 [Desulfobulbia bacterium]
MKTTQLELSEEEQEDIINQFEDGRYLIPEEYGDENTTDIDHYRIKSIDPVFEVTQMKGYCSGENEWTTPMKLKITSCMCFDEDLDVVDIDDEAEKLFVAAMNERFDVEDEIKEI